MTGLEPLFKIMPIAGFILAAVMGYGELKSDIKHLDSTQTKHFDLIQHQLDQIQERLNK